MNPNLTIPLHSGRKINIVTAAIKKKRAKWIGGEKSMNILVARNIKKCP